MGDIENFKLLAERAIVGIYNSGATYQAKVEALHNLSETIQTHLRAIEQNRQAEQNQPLAWWARPQP